MPTVFISHSCKDHEQAPPANLSATDAAARASRLAFARALRDTLYAALKKQKDYTVFLDVRGGLKAGDIWQDGLHNALRTCDAGVVLLTPESLESGWVLKEATILSWRAFLRERVLLVPVVLGVTVSDLETRGFGALALNQIQWVTVANTDGAAVKTAVAEIVAALRTIPPSPLVADRTTSPTETWVLELAQQLQFVTAGGLGALAETRLVQMCRALGIPREQRARFDKDPLVTLASHALVADEGQIVRLLNAAGRPPKALREELKETVSVLWVDPTPASRLAAGAAKVIALDAREVKSAREYVLRAYCNQIDRDRIIMPTDVTDGSDGATIAAILESIGKRFSITDAAALTREVDDNGPLFVILGPGSVRPSILDLLTRDYPQFTWVTVVGPSPETKLGDWWGKARMLYPLLQPDREDAADRFRNRLNDYVTG